MELLDRYLQAVKKHLPLKRQDDIIAELRANLESQLEEKESELGRPLTQGEAEDWLRQVGPPTQMASPYQPQQYLIGPAIFPMYWYVLRMAFLWAMLIYTIVSTVVIVFQTPHVTALAGAIAGGPRLLMSVAAWVTLVFAALEFASVHYPDKCPSIAGLTRAWDPAKLPPLETIAPSGKKPKSYAHAVAEIVFGFLFLGWFVLMPQYPYLIFGPGAFYFGASPYRLGPVWVDVFWWIVALNLVQLLWRTIDFWRGTWQYTPPLQNIVVKAFGLVPLGLLLSIHDRSYVLLRHPELDQVRLASTLNGINIGIHTGLLLLCTVVGLQVAWDIVQALRDSWRRRESARA